MDFYIIGVKIRSYINIVKKEAGINLSILYTHS